ncbi:hypothetical protein TrVGV298_008099 [Trichoderma virens]|nr:hypothetical protein TrVGV298_008099 [Trichoderma virens]
MSHNLTQNSSTQAASRLPPTAGPYSYVGSDSTGPGIVNITNYSILSSDGSVPDDINVPIAKLIIVQLNNLTRLEIAPADTNFEATYYDYGLSVKFDVLDVDPTIAVGLPQRSKLRHNGSMRHWYSISSGLANGTGFNLTAGAFRPLLRILRYGANGISADGYESWLGPIMNVKTS